MKRSIRLLPIVLLGLAPATLCAQGGFGIKGGLSYGNVSNRGILPGSLSVRTGFAVGVALGSATSLFGFGIEGMYAQRGVRSATDGSSRKLDYVDVPVYLRATIPTPVAFYAYAGPQMSFELHCSAGNADCPASDRPKRTTAAVLGGGVRIGPRSGFTLEGRYIYGLTDLKLNTITSSSSYKTRSFLVLAGFFSETRVREVGATSRSAM
jgi:hypothetical protein